MTFLGASGVTMQVDGRRILDGLDLLVARSELVVIVGPNGAGKSTLLAVLAGVTTPTGGVVTIEGRNLNDLNLAELARRRAYLPTDLLASIRFTVREVVEMGRHPWSTFAEDEQRISTAIDALGLGELSDHVYSTLSTGEARRTHLARILAQDTPLLLLDEPTSGLDIAHAESILARLRALTGEEKTIVMVMHDLNSAVRIADRIVVMTGGTIVAEGAPDEVVTGELLSDVYQHPIGVVEHPMAPRRLITPLDGHEPA